MAFSAFTIVDRTVSVANARRNCSYDSSVEMTADNLSTSFITEATALNFIRIKSGYFKCGYAHSANPSRMIRDT